MMWGARLAKYNVRMLFWKILDQYETQCQVLNFFVLDSNLNCNMS